MKAIRSLQPKASTRPASSARQPARSSFVIEWSCCWSRHHSMREMMLVGSYFMGPSWANVSLPLATRNYPKLGGMYYQVNPSIWGGENLQGKVDQYQHSFRYADALPSQKPGAS